MKHAKEIIGTVISGSSAVTGHVVTSVTLADIASIVAILSGVAVVAQIIHNWNRKSDH